MPVPVDPFPDFVNNVDTADGDQVDARFKALYDALNPAQAGIDDAMINTSGISKVSALAIKTAMIDLLQITTGLLAAGAVTPAKTTSMVASANGTGYRIGFGGPVNATYVDGERLTVTVAHGLAATPVACDAHPINPFGPAFIRSVDKDATNLYITVGAGPGITFIAGNLISVSYWAMGV